jgi:ribosomal protein S18 acetylase RimI-like enzyme
VVRVSKELELAAATRLVSQSNPDIETAARRLVASAPVHGIDLSLIWGTLEPGKTRKPKVRQACLAVLGAGRTAMLFVSEPAPDGDFGDAGAALAERIAVIDAACEHLGKEVSDHVQIAQALPDPAEPWSVEAFTGAGFVNVGNLSYLRREAGPLPQTPAAPGAKGKAARTDPPLNLGPGVTLRRVSELATQGLDETMVEALDRTYIDTLDCPELCGLRETRDVLDSHRDTGQYDPKLWWLVFLNGEPHGCALFSRCPEVRAAELVYLGLSPALRGRGMGRTLLRMGIEEVRREHPTWSMTLAVDHRNAPARHLYESLGFRPFGERVAFVRRVVP